MVKSIDMGKSNDTLKYEQLKEGCVVADERRQL